jgi:hypothetical protein
MKTSTKIVSLLLLTSSLIQAQFVDILSLGSSSFSINATNSSSGIYSQTSSALSFTSTVSEGDSVVSNGGLSLDWSAYGTGNFSVSLTPNTSGSSLAFSMFLLDSSEAFIQLNGEASTAAGYAPLTYISGDSAILSNINQISISWAAPGNPSIDMNAIAVPEPSTYALMALGGLVLFFIARRRKAQV